MIVSNGASRPRRSPQEHQDRHPTASPARLIPPGADDLQAHAAVMEGLRGRVTALSALFDPARPVAYLDLPLHFNIGDLLIYLATESFFTEAGLRVSHRAPCDGFPLRSGSAVGSSQVICLHGGGNFGDLYPQHQAFREAVLERFPDNPVIVLPQSVHFRCRDTEQRSLRRFRRHRNLTVCVRDLQSLRTLRAAGLERVLLVPDMAHILWSPTPDLSPAGRPAGGPLHLIRRDGESAAADSGSGADWSDLVRASERAALRLFRAAARRRLPVAPLWHPLARRIAARGRGLLADAAAVRTDRLHGVILAALLSRHVTPLDNSYGKVTGYVRQWLADSPLVAGPD